MQETRPAGDDDHSPVAAPEGPTPKVSPDFLDGEAALGEELPELRKAPGPCRERGLERPRGKFAAAVAIAVRRTPEPPAAGRPPGLRDFQQAAGAADETLEEEGSSSRPVQRLEDEPSRGSQGIGHVGQRSAAVFQSCQVTKGIA